MAKFVNYLKRGIVTVHGEIEVHRAYYYCKHCKQSSIPWDEVVGLDQGLSHGLRSLVCLAGTLAPFDDWKNLKLRGGAIGAGGSYVPPEESSIVEITPAELSLILPADTTPPRTSASI